MKTYERRKELTRTEAARLLIANNWEPINCCEFFDGDHEFDDSDYYGSLTGVDGELGFWDSGSTCWERCAHIEQVNPRDVPEGCAPLPEDKPWLAYVGLGGDRKSIGANNMALYWNATSGWVTSRGHGGMCSVMTHYAIDVRTEFAKEHFPEIVACYADEPFMQPAPRYGYTDDGELIVAPEGWEIVPEDFEEHFSGKIIYKDGETTDEKMWRGGSNGICGDIRAYIRRKSPIAKGHNPAGLTEVCIGDIKIDGKSFKMEPIEGKINEFKLTPID